MYFILESCEINNSSRDVEILNQGKLNGGNPAPESAYNNAFTEKIVLEEMVVEENHNNDLGKLSPIELPTARRDSIDYYILICFWLFSGFSVYEEANNAVKNDKLGDESYVENHEQVAVFESIDNAFPKEFVLEQISMPGPSQEMIVQENPNSNMGKVWRIELQAAVQLTISLIFYFILVLSVNEKRNKCKKNYKLSNEDSFSDFSQDESDYVPSNSSSDSEGASNINTNSDSQVTKRKNQLSGMQEYPEITNKPRRKKRKPEMWQRNIRKKNRLEGKEYVSTKGIIKPAVKIMPPCNKTCRIKCFTIPEAERLKIFEAYYQLADYSRQRDFIHANSEKEIKKNNTTQNKSRRNYSVNYFLPINGIRKKVCKPMFLNTLGIKKGVVDIALKKRTKENVATSDGRGKRNSKILDPAIVRDIISHIQSFPCVPSHYCRAESTRKYLDASLNLATMYRMYVQWCQENNEKAPAKLSTYRNVFKDNFNLGFHTPRKDQCRVCVAFNNDAYPTEGTKTNYETHLKLKDNARDAKRLDKEVAATNNTIVSCNFDLQQVLLCPADPKNNALFYKRRLATYNFTIYNVVTKQGDCFMWHESLGGRGSCEIASLLFNFFKSLPDSVEEVRCFSDRCGGQNLNKYVVAMCMYAVQFIEKLKTIHLKFLTPGHSEMECDSMHSAIDTEFRRVGKALWPGDWKTIARSARKKGDKPYTVHDIQANHFFDWKAFADTHLTIRKTDTNNRPVLFQKLCWFQFKKENVFEYECKESFESDNFRRVDCKKKALRRQSTSLLPCYPQARPIPESKYKDLMSLFSMNPPALSNDYFDFYANLPHGGIEED